MRVKTKNTTYAMMYGAGKIKGREVLRDENKYIPARAVKKAFVLIFIKRINAIPKVLHV